MAILAGSKEAPDWLEETRVFCRNSGIEIVGWGADMLVVEAKSPEAAQEIASQLGQLGFTVIKDEDDADAGLLSLSKSPAAALASTAAFDISRRPLGEQVEPLIWAVCSLLLIPGLYTNRDRWITLPLGVLSAIMFFWDGSRIWGWRLELVPEGLRVRRRFRWSTILWKEIRAVESVAARWGRNQEFVMVKLTSHASERLGRFNYAFARNLRDRVRYELAQRQPQKG